MTSISSYAETMRTYFQNNSRIKEYQAHSSKVHSINWSCDGRRLASGSYDRTVSLFLLERDRLCCLKFWRESRNCQCQIKLNMASNIYNLNNQSFSDSFSSKVYTIGGVPIHFPCKAYPSQITMMDRIVKCLNKKHNCLLESPTGSGKSLALLCASLSWQKKVKKEIEDIEAELDDHLNAYGAAIDEPCPVHHTIRESSACCNDIKYTNQGECSNVSPKCASRSPYFSEKVNHNLNKTNSSSPVRKQDNKKGVNFINENDFEDFMPTKKYRNSFDSSQFIKLGPSKNSLCSDRSPSSLTVRNKRLTDSLRGELSDFQSSSMVDQKNLDFRNEELSNDSLNNVWCTCKQKQKYKEEKIKKEQSSITLPTKLPVIYFGTRTHKQIEQIIRELKKTIYKDTKMTILSSRERSCVNQEVLSADNKNEACDELIKADGGPACRYFRNSKTLSHCHSPFSTAFDLEDFVKICKKMRACPYFGSRELLLEADIVFCPYNYLVDPLIRSAMSINLKDNIIIMDEAHNIEDSARSAASASFSSLSFQESIPNLERVSRFSKKAKNSYLFFADMFKAISEFLIKNINNLTQYVDMTQSYKIWNGNDMIAVLSLIKIGPENFLEFSQHFHIILSEESESNEDEVVDLDKLKLPSSTLMVLKGLFQILSYLYKDNLRFISDYRCVIKKSVTKRNFAANRYAANQMDLSLNFWCLNPAVAFSDIKDNIYSLIVASGTLSPMSSFTSELGMNFQITLEANHVISKSQLWVGSIASGPNNVPFLATFQNSQVFGFQDELGTVILQICNIIPHGVLCFFPSYYMMEKLIARWQMVGIWDLLSHKKVLFCEPKTNQELSSVMSDFYSVIEASENGTNSNGALFFAVFRGKVSEGLDFADNNARAVITVGIPFPNIKDVQVILKREYNTKYAQEKNILNGTMWYDIQAYRAMNQALGRCIRHKEDYGALIIIEERFHRKNCSEHLSKWIRQEIEHFSSSTEALSSLEIFADKNGMKNLNPAED